MKNIVKLIAAFYFLSNICFAAKFIHYTLELANDKVISLEQLPSTVYNANHDIISYTIKSPNTLYISAKKIGKTDLILLNKDGKIIKKIFIKVTPKISDVRDLLKQAFPRKSKKLKFSSINDNLVISGVHYSLHSKEKILELVSRIIPKEKIVDMTTIKDNKSNPQINLRIRVVEMSRDVKKALGLNFGLNFGTTNGINSSFSFNSSQLKAPTHSSTFNNFLIGSDTTPGLFFGNFSLRSLLNIMSEEHIISSLAEPNLILMPDQPASFLFGGEVPLNNQAGLGGTSAITYKEFGIKIKATAKILKNDIIRLQLSPSISKLSKENSLEILDAANNPIEIPGFSTRNIETTIELKSGQSIAIAGLIENETIEEESHIPGLNKIPLISDATRQENAHRREKEIVFIVTPYLVHPGGNGSLETPVNDSGMPHGSSSLGKPGFILE